MSNAAECIDLACNGVTQHKPEWGPCVGSLDDESQRRGSKMARGCMNPHSLAATAVALPEQRPNYGHSSPRYIPVTRAGVASSLAPKGTPLTAMTEAQVQAAWRCTSKPDWNAAHRVAFLAAVTFPTLAQAARLHVKPFVYNSVHPFRHIAKTICCTGTTVVGYCFQCTACKGVQHHKANAAHNGNRLAFCREHHPTTTLKTERRQRSLCWHHHRRAQK